MSDNDVNISPSSESVDEFEAVFNLKIGYTQGELQDGDYEDDGLFKAGNNILWRYTVLKDFDGLIRIIDWDVGKGLIYNFDDDETLSKDLSYILKKISGRDDKFGREIVATAFESVIQYAFDPDLGSYPCSDEVIEKIGGDLYLEKDSDAIPDDYVNSLFSLTEILSCETISLSDGVLYIDGKPFDIKNETYSIDEHYVVGFTEDVMDYQ